jgi:hypothetical protein
MGSGRQRENRRIVFLKARMRVAEGWIDITICNISSRGLMAKCACPPQKGEYVEIRQRGTCIVARVAWSHNARFGVRSQDIVDLAALLADSGIKVRRAGEDRRVRERPKLAVARRSVVEQADRNRLWGRMFDWILIAGATAFGATQLVQVTSEAFATPMAVVQSNLTAKP